MPIPMRGQLFSFVWILTELHDILCTCACVHVYVAWGWNRDVKTEKWENIEMNLGINASK